MIKKIEGEKMNKKKKNKKKINFKGLPLFYGFIVNDIFWTWCQFCNTWHQYRICDPRLRKGYKIIYPSHCVNPQSPFYNYPIYCKKIPNRMKNDFLVASTFYDLKEYLGYANKNL